MEKDKQGKRKIKWKKGIVCALLVGGTVLLTGQKAEAGEQLTDEQKKEYQQDGTLKERIQYYKDTGAEHYSDGLIQKKSGASAVAAYSSNIPESWGNYMPAEGEAKILLIRVDFPGTTFEEGDTEEALNEIAFGGNDSAYTAYPYESLQAYYDRSSYGKVHISGNTVSYTAQHERSYYEQTGIADLYKETLDALDPQIDFSQYDGDGNGYIDGLYLHFAGENSGWGSIWWSQVYHNLLSDTQYDGTYVGGCATLHEKSNSKEGAITMIHETGHLFGLSDYYNYNTQAYGDGMGAYDMMMDNRGDHNAFSKWLLGWIRDDEVRRISMENNEPVEENVTLESLSKAKDGEKNYKCAVISPSDGGLFSEYLLVEYDTEQQNQSGLRYNGKKLPDGFRVFHVNATLNDNGTFEYSNSDTRCQLIRQVDKDQIAGHYYNYDLETPELTEVAGCTDTYECKFEKGDTLTPDTTPSTDLYQGQIMHKSGISVTEFQPDGDQGTVNIRIDQAKVTKDDLEITAEDIWKDINQNNVVLIPLTLKTDAELDENNAPYLIDQEGKKVTGKLTKGEETGKYFLIIQADYLAEGDYECVIPEGAFRLGTVVSDELKINVHVGTNMTKESSGSLDITDSLYSCKAGDSGWYVLAPNESEGTEAVLYKIGEDGNVTEHRIDKSSWTKAWGYNTEGMQPQGIFGLSDGTLAMSFMDYNTDQYALVHMNEEGEILDTVQTLQGYDWTISVIGNTLKAKKIQSLGSDTYQICSIEFGEEKRELEMDGTKTCIFMQDGYILYGLENKATEGSEENDMWAKIEYRDEKDNVVATWEYPYGEEEGKLDLYTPAGAAEDAENIYVFQLASQGSSFKREDYVLGEMHLGMYTINKKTGEYKKESLKDEVLRTGTYVNNYGDIEFCDTSVQDGKILFSIQNRFCPYEAPVIDTYCVEKEAGITKRIGRYYSSGSILSGTKVMEISWSEEKPEYLIYDAKDASDTPDTPNTPDIPDTPAGPGISEPEDKPATPAKAGNMAGKTSEVKKITATNSKTKSSKKAVTAKTGDSAKVRIYMILGIISGGILIIGILKRRRGK